MEMMQLSARVAINAMTMMAGNIQVLTGGLAVVVSATNGEGAGEGESDGLGEGEGDGENIFTFQHQVRC